MSKPYITVHTIAKSHNQKYSIVTKFWYGGLPVILALLVGIVVGSVMVWQGKFSEANKQAELIIPTSNTQEQWSMPLEFNQSELQIVTDMLPILVAENRHAPTPEELANAHRKEQLRTFLSNYKSPFAENDDTLQAFLDAKNMKLMLAISFVESTLGKKCYYYNCSGIGGYPPTLRKYDSHADWVRDFDNLLERRYKGLPVEKFMGLYVQPGSPNWIAGVRQILASLKQSGIE